MKIVTDKKFKLCPEGIDMISEELYCCLSQYNVIPKKDKIRIRLSAEEILLNWFSEIQNINVSLCVIQKGKKLDIKMKLLDVTTHYDPISTEEFSGIGTIDNYMANLGTGWVYQMDNGLNSVYTSISVKKNNRPLQTALALLLSVVVIFIVKLLPPEFAVVLNDYLVQPVFDMFSGFLTIIVAPMMFLAVIGGVLSIGSPGYLNVYGKIVCRRYLISSFIIIIIAGLFAILLFGFDYSSFGAVSDIKLFIDFVESIIPTDIISPFSDGNMLQICFMAVIIGTALLLIQNQIQVFNDFIEDSNIIILKIIDCFENMFLPFFIFLGTVNVGITTELSKLSGFVKMFGFFVIFLVVGVIIQLVSASLKTKLSIPFIWNNLKGSLLSGLLSASSSAAFSDSYNACEKVFGVEKRLTRFSLPIGTVIHKPYVAVEFIFFVFATKEYMGQKTDVLGFVILLILAFILSVAYPPISGGEISCYVLLLTQVGLPIEMLALACALSTVLDFIEVPANILSTELQLLHVSKKLDLMTPNTSKKG